MNLSLPTRFPKTFTHSLPKNPSHQPKLTHLKTIQKTTPELDLNKKNQDATISPKRIQN
jgi:hypothetical protein